MIDRVGQRFGAYRLKRLLSNRGAFADVYEGEHVIERTQVAIKAWKVQIEIKTFLNDVHAAVLTHPHIMKVLDFGIEDDIPYLVMAYAPYGSLQSQRLPLPLDTITVYVRDIADALQHAHQHGIVHRDIKPDNILLGPHHEIWVGDFGIATPSYTKQEEPEKQSVAGTYAYMAPEQMRGHASSASDQYALGIMTYEWLCGERPFHGRNIPELYHQHNYISPPLLRGKIPTIAPEVEQVILKAIDKDPHKRFESVEAFARAMEQAALVQQELFRVTHTPSSVPVESQTTFTSTPVGTTLHTYRVPWYGVLALTWLSNGLYLASSDITGTIQLWDITTKNLVRTYYGHSQEILCMAWSPDGTHISSGGKDQGVQIWRIKTGDCLRTYRGHSAAVELVAWSPDGTRIASCSGSVLQIWEVATGKLIRTYKDTSMLNQINALAWSPDGRRIAFNHPGSSDDVIVEVRDTSTGELISKYTVDHRNKGKKGRRKLGHERIAISWSPDGTHIASGPYDKDDTIHVWKVRTGEQVSHRRSNVSNQPILTWSPDGRWIASSSNDTSVDIWDAMTGKKSMRILSMLTA